MEKIECPACGSDDVQTETRCAEYAPPFGAVRSYTVEEHTCQHCGESGDFRGDSSTAIQKVISEADLASVERMLLSLDAEGHSMAYIERALGLPARTLARWKRGEASAGAIALLRLIRAFPWLLEVSASRFAPESCRQAVVSAAGQVFYDFSQAHDVTYSVTHPDPHTVTVRLARCVGDLDLSNPEVDPRRSLPPGAVLGVGTA